MTHDAEGRVRARIQRLPDASHVMCAVAELNELLQSLADTRNLIATFKACNWPQTWAQTRDERDQALAERDRLRTELADTRQQLDEARGIARVLVHQHIGIHDATIECEVHLNLDALPDWLTREPQPAAGPTRQGHDTTTSEGN